MNSKGYKRLITAIIVLLGKILDFIPGLQGVTTGTEFAAGAMGAIGLGHAAAAKTIADRRLTSATSVFAVLFVIADLIPGLAQYAPILQNIAAVLAALGLGNEVTTKLKADKQ